MVGGLPEAKNVMARKTVELVRVGKYAAEVPVELIEDEGGWSPYLSFDDAKKVETVRLALESGDLARAAKLARIFELLPISA
jgi:hypothetical protein